MKWPSAYSSMPVSPAVRLRTRECSSSARSSPCSNGTVAVLRYVNEIRWLTAHTSVEETGRYPRSRYIHGVLRFGLQPC